MNVPHLQYMHHPNQPSGVNVQQPPQQQQIWMQHPNPLLAVINQNNGQNTAVNQNISQNGPVFPYVHPIQQLQAQQQVPIIREVWSHNLEKEFNDLRTFTNDKTSAVYVSIHQEIPGIVARPVGTFKSSADYHFQTLRSNSDLLNLIQLSICVVKVHNNDISNSVIWQFNFLFDITKEMFNEEHLSMLSQSSQINFQLHISEGIPHSAFAELLIESGLLLDNTVTWISFHAGYDLGFLLSLLTNDRLPVNEEEFQWWVNKYFPNFLDLKFIGNQVLSKSGADKSSNKPSIEYLAEELHLLPISPLIRQYFTNSHNVTGSQQMTSNLHAYLVMECFKELLRQSGFDNSLFAKFKGLVWGLSASDALTNSIQAPSTPSSNSRQGAVHITRPL